jgi:hypothetical protein
MPKKMVLVTGLLLLRTLVFSQNYHAVNGSSYAGSLGVGNNPSSIVNTPFAWDIDLFSIQAKPATNVVSILNYSLLSSGANSEYLFTGGNQRRFANTNVNLNLLNMRFALNRRSAIAVGFNIRSYVNLKTSSYNFIDTLGNVRDFFKINDPNAEYNLEMTSSSWAEIYGTYARTIIDNERTRLNAGVTLKVMRGLSGGHAALKSGKVERVVENGENVYVLKDAAAQYGYSANYDPWLDRNKESKQTWQQFAQNTEGGVSFDIGVEYLIKPYVLPDFNDNEDRYYDYDWKIGVSIMDIGVNNFKYGTNSRTVSGFKGDVRDIDLDQKFANIDGVADFNDSLETIVNNMGTLRGPFTILSPTRLIVNVDRYLFDAFYLNADLSINLSPLAKKYLYVKEQNLVTITPRWEIKNWGVYMPVIFNTDKQLRIGGAFKAGPLLLGVHNWAAVFGKKSMQNGGGYLAIVIRAGHNTGQKESRKYDCPKY